MTPLTGFSICFVGNAVVLALLCTLAPGLRPALLEEDRLVENLTAFFFFCGFFVTALRLALSREGHRATLALVCGLALLACLDELSFGERLFELSMPTVAGTKIDGLHDFVSLAVRRARAAGAVGLASVAAAALVAGAAAAAVAWRQRDRVARTWRAARGEPALTLVGLGAGLVAAAMVLDLHLFHVPGPPNLIEEVFEMNAGLAMLFAGISAARRRAPDPAGAPAPHPAGG